MTPPPDAATVYATLRDRETLVEQLVAHETPLARHSLIEAVDRSRPTVRSWLDELSEWQLIERNDDGITLTLAGTLCWETYRTFDRQLAMIGADTPGESPLWQGANERRDVMELVASRRPLLDCIESTPHDTRTLNDALDLSRSTINRATQTLSVTGLVERTTDGYALTPAGQRVLTQYRTSLATFGNILAAKDVLIMLPPDAPLPPELLTEATVTQPENPRPYHLPPGIQERIGAAERVRLCLPALATPRLLDCCHQGVVQDGLALELLTSPELFETLTNEFPGPLAEMATAPTGDCTAYEVTSSVSLPSFGLVIAETATATTISVLIYSTHQTIEGVIHTETAAASQWADAWYAETQADTTEVTTDLHDLAPAKTSSGSVGLALSPANDTDRVAREAEGFVRLTPDYFAERAPAPPLTGWRAGFDLVDVHAGYALDREVERDGTRHNLTTELTEALTEGTNQAVLGAPGSGKSIICKSVACRWYEQGNGPVVYRKSGTGAEFDSPAVLREHLRTAATDGHVLVVVEDAVRAEANAIFRVMKTYRGNANVTFLLDARESEWTDPESMPTDAGLTAYRYDATETVFVPPLDDRETERFVRQFERTFPADHTIDSTVVEQFQANDTTANGVAPEIQAEFPTDNRPGELLVFLHHLVSSAAPLVVDETPMPTSFIEDVKRTYDTLAEISDLALDVGVLVNLLNAAGISVQLPLVCALATERDDTDITGIREALTALEGRVLFDRKEENATEASPFRTIHEMWSIQFLEQLQAAEIESAAHQRFGRCVTALLSLADEEMRREQLRSAFIGEISIIERIATAPTEWADTTVKRLFGLGLRRRQLAPLFGRTGTACLDIPAACSAAVTVNCTLWRAEMAEEGRDLDRAEHEYECLVDRAEEVVATAPTLAASLRGRRLRGLGNIARHRGEYDTAEAYYANARDHAQTTDNQQQLAAARNNLGLVALDRGEIETARAALTQSREMLRDLGFIGRAAVTLINLGMVARLAGELEATVEYYQQAVDNFRTVGDRSGEATCLTHLGRVNIELGRFDQAEQYCTQALSLSRQTGTPAKKASSLVHLGRINKARGDLETAETYYRQSLDIRQEIGDRVNEAMSRNALGKIARKRGDLDLAFEQCMASHEMSATLGNRRADAQILMTLGKIIRERGDLDTATEHARESLTLCEDIGAGAYAAESRRLLGQIACDRERFTTAEEHLMQALCEFQEMDYQYEEAKTLASLGTLARCRDNRECAREWFEEAIDQYREMGAIRDVIETGEQLTAVCESIGDLDAALDYCTSALNLTQETDFITPPASLAEQQDRLTEHSTTDSAS
jgi:tetratricopeptide (TPR) repeat protein/predicted transcriptional regulator